MRGNIPKKRRGELKSEVRRVVSQPTGRALVTVSWLAEPFPRDTRMAEVFRLDSRRRPAYRNNRDHRA